MKFGKSAFGLKLQYQAFLEMLFSIKRFWNKAKSGDQIKNMQKKVSKLKCVLQNLLVNLKNIITYRSVVIYLLEFLTRSFFVYFLQVGKVKVCVIFFFAKKISENLRNLQCLKNLFVIGYILVIILVFYMGQFVPN